MPGPRAENPGRFTVGMKLFPPHRRARQRLVATGAALAIGSASFIALVTPAAADDASGRYQVRRGDTLSQVALDHGVTPSALADANGISNHDVIYAGTWLTIPGGSQLTSTGGGAQGAGTSSYAVQPGDTLISVAARFGLSPSTLASANGLSDPNLVRSGTTLQIPGSGGSSDGSASAPAADSNGSSSGSGVTAKLQAQGRYWLASSMQHWAAEYGVPADLLSAMTYLESGWQSSIVSSTGAIGIGQLMPDTIRLMQARIGVPLDPRNPDDNTRMTAAFLRLLLDETGWDASQALAAYYQGLGALPRTASTTAPWPTSTGSSRSAPPSPDRVRPPARTGGASCAIIRRDPLRTADPIATTRVPGPGWSGTTKEDMADDDLDEDLDNDLEEEPSDDELDEDEIDEDAIEADAIDGDDLLPGAEDEELVDDEEDEDEPAPVKADRPKAASDDDEEDDDDEADPDDVEEDLDTILKDRIAAGTDEEEDDEELVTEDRTETGDRVSPRKPEEISCPECFLLVRSSQFSTRRNDCPGGLDTSDCPMPALFGSD